MIWEDTLKLNNILIKLMKDFSKSLLKPRTLIIIIIIIIIKIIFFVNLIF